MRADTRLFGTIDIADDKLITMEKGMIGFPDLQHFALIFDEERGLDKSNIMWLQSMDEPVVAFPVMMPSKIKPDYNPKVSEEMIAPLGDLTPDNTFLLVTVTVPKEIEQMADNEKAVQLIVEDDYPVKYKIYDLLKAEKEGKVE